MCYGERMIENNAQSESPKLTPQQLADKMAAVVDEVRRLGTPPESDKPENEWAKEAVDNHNSFSEGVGKVVGDNGSFLPLQKIKELCPEFYNQVLIPAFDMADNATSVYKKPSLPLYIDLDGEANRFANYHCTTNEGEITFFHVGISAITKQHSVNSTICSLAHEFGHCYQDLEELITKFGFKDPNPQNTGKPFPRSYNDSTIKKEFDADRARQNHKLLTDN